MGGVMTDSGDGRCIAPILLGRAMDNDELLAEIERRRNDPEFIDRLERIMTEDADVLNRLEPHLGPIKIGCRRCGQTYDPTAGDHSLGCRPVG